MAAGPEELDGRGLARSYARIAGPLDFGLGTTATIGQPWKHSWTAPALACGGDRRNINSNKRGGDRRNISSNKRGGPKQVLDYPCSVVDQRPHGRDRDQTLDNPGFSQVSGCHAKLLLDLPSTSPADGQADGHQISVQDIGEPLQNSAPPGGAQVS